WDPQQAQLPVNGSVSVSAGKRMGEKLRVLLTLGQSSSYEHTNGVFRQYRSNFIDDTIPDATYWKKYTATSALANVGFRPNDGNKLKFVSLYINTLEDQVFEGGRAGTATIFEETDPAEGLFQFIRDQNTKTTLLAVNQLAGEHTLDERNTLHWAVGYNYLKADEPNRIRNEVNFNPTTVQLGRTGGFQQRKGLQKITDVEHNARVHDKLKIMDHQTSSLHIGLGGNYRSKRRNFGSQFFGVEETSTNAINPESIDRISEIFTQQNFDNGLLKRNTLQPDVYDGLLESAAGFIDVTGVYSKFSFQAGLRYQRDAINVNFNVGNVPGRAGSASKQYARLYPSVNLKYAFTEKVSLRFANSITVTLPEFKEIAPFEYISQTGQVTRGNPNIEASRNHNYDLKFEYFPSNGQLLSLTGFYKKIDDPINKMQDRGAAGVFSYFNVGEKAEVMGIELETKANVINGKEKGTPNLALRFNATRMWHTQGLKDVFADNGTFVRSFRYKGLKKTGLQGASDWILNTSINLSTNGENPIEVSLSGTYSSDKIFALGSPEEQTTSDINYNDAIVEKGFVALNLILNKRINNHWNVGFSGKNLLDPQIKRTQLVRPSTTGIETEQTVQSYTRGVGLGINLNYTF
ncbi:MAG: TonB-dependent receptor domain-containing protein, partial [Marinirhabdus sp.]